MAQPVVTNSRRPATKKVIIPSLGTEKQRRSWGTFGTDVHLLFGSEVQAINPLQILLDMIGMVADLGSGRHVVPRLILRTFT